MIHIAVDGAVALYAVYLKSGSKQLYDCDQHTPLNKARHLAF